MIPAIAGLGCSSRSTPAQPAESSSSSVESIISTSGSVRTFSRPIQNDSMALSSRRAETTWSSRRSNRVARQRPAVSFARRSAPATAGHAPRCSATPAVASRDPAPISRHLHRYRRHHRYPYHTPRSRLRRCRPHHDCPYRSPWFCRLLCHRGLMSRRPPLYCRRIPPHARGVVANQQPPPRGRARRLRCQRVSATGSVRCRSHR